MCRIALVLAIAGCYPDGDYNTGDWISDDLTATIALTGDQLDLNVNAQVYGSVREGSPFTISSPQIETLDCDVIDIPELTTGDQGFDDATVYLVDTRTHAPTGLLAHCGEVVRLELTLAAEMADDGHLESAHGLTSAPIDCY